MNEQVLRQFEKLPDYLGAHIELSAYALGLGVALSVPTAVLVAKCRPLRWPILTAAGVIQTIPSLALLALMVPLIGFGFRSALLALLLYSILPILRNTVTGIAQVDPALTEAGRGMGMTPMQLLMKVELPLAAPLIIAGIRTATVWVVGIATLATPVGQTCLGNYIFSGLQTRNWTAVVFGCVAAALLAVVLDALIAVAESGAQKRSRARWAVAVTGLVLVIGGGWLSPVFAGLVKRERTVAAAVEAEAVPTADESLGTIRIGSKTFTEQYILAGLIAGRLERAGFHVERVESLGSTVGFDALRTSEIDVFVDYSGTIWANYMKREDTAPGWRVLEEVGGWLAREHGIRCLGPLGFENTYAVAMTRERAEALGISTIEDLAEHAPGMGMGGDYEFFSRPEWYKLRDTYGLSFDRLVNFDSSLMYRAVAEGEVDAVTAFSTDGRIAAFDLLTLKDPRHVFPPYDAVLLLSPRVADDPAVARALLPLVGGIDVRMMRQANQVIDVDQDPIADAARWLDEQITGGN
jgi:osmoprotectant transport system permease protein